MSDDFICSSCKKQKHRLRARQSKLVPHLKLYLCDTCFDNKLEPRWAIIMASRTNGVESVRDYLRNHKYIGKTIAAEELV